MWETEEKIGRGERAIRRKGSGEGRVRDIDLGGIHSSCACLCCFVFLSTLHKPRHTLEEGISVSFIRLT